MWQGRGQALNVLLSGWRDCSKPQCGEAGTGPRERPKIGGSTETYPRAVGSINSAPGSYWTVGSFDNGVEALDAATPGKALAPGVRTRGERISRLALLLHL